MLSVTNKALMPSVVMLNVVILSAIMLSVVAPCLIKLHILNTFTAAIKALCVKGYRADHACNSAVFLKIMVILLLYSCKLQL